jgi:Zn-dependent protease
LFGKRIALFELFGFKVNVDISWLFLVVLITWSLAKGYFPALYPDLPQKTYWWMGTAGVIGLFFSIVFHELSHSVVARRFGLPITGITLFVFGGVAEMEEEPPSPKAEFRMAIAGPIASILLAGGFYVVLVAGRTMGLPDSFLGITHYLSFINALLAGFNLLPAFPLDGGRVFRAGLWAWKADLRWATRLASRVGAGCGAVLMALGVLSIVTGTFVVGMWWFLIGMFLHNAATASYQQLLARRSLEGERLRRFMTSDPITVSQNVSIAELVENYIYAYHYDLFPVVEGSRLTGCVTVRTVRGIPREMWPTRTVGDIVQPCTPENTIEPDMDTVDALALMRRTGNSRLMVVSDDRLVGVIALKDMLEFLALKIELEERR